MTRTHWNKADWNEVDCKEVVCRRGFETARLQSRRPEPKTIRALAPEGVINQNKEEE
jgi:hypothetical protein